VKQNVIAAIRNVSSPSGKVILTSENLLHCNFKKKSLCVYELWVWRFVQKDW